MTSSRFFISNLPANAKEKHLAKLFENFGEVQNVELKSKENLVDPNDLKIIAFVTLGIDTEAVQQCLREINGQKIKGQQISVALAKESFLERLKRERAEAGLANTVSNPSNQTESSYLLQPNSRNKRVVFNNDDEQQNADANADDTNEILIKKHAKSSLCNGKITIQSYSSDVQPLHVIEKKSNRKRKISETEISKTVAEEKRKASLNKMKHNYQQQKNIIQQSLQDNLKAIKSRNTKLHFDDKTEDDENTDDMNLTRSSKTVNIFGSDNEDADASEDDKEIKPFFLGKKGAKLAELQSASQNIDPRFRIDEKFVDDDDSNDKSHISQLHNDDDNDEQKDNERDWQMNILEQVVGKQLTSIAPPKPKNRNMLRYDPNKDEHQKFELTVEKTDQKPLVEKSKSKSTSKSNSSQLQSTTNEVSKEVFYVVTDTLKQSLKTHDGSFSLLKMFDKLENHLEKREDQLKELNNEKILVRKNNKLGRALISNPFTYDSSSDSEFENINESKAVEEANNKSKDSAETAKNIKKPSKKKNQLKSEKFFFNQNDERFKEGSNFFKLDKSLNDSKGNENYDEVRSRLKLLIKKKITKTKKNLQNAGYKTKRRSKY